MAGTQKNHHVTDSKNYRRPLDQDEYKRVSVETSKTSDWVKELPKGTEVENTWVYGSNDGNSTVRAKREVIGEAMAKAAAKKIKKK